MLPKPDIGAPMQDAAGYGCGCSSGVEHNLAKVGVEGSNPFARSKLSPNKFNVLSMAPVPSEPEANGFNEPTRTVCRGISPHGLQHKRSCFMGRLGSALIAVGTWLSLIAALMIAVVTAPWWLFARDDEEEPEPLPEELRKAAESQDPS
jgi:hypothetical protein